MVHNRRMPRSRLHRLLLGGLAGAVLAGAAASYQHFRNKWGDIPFVHAAYVPHDESKPHAHALTSTILFDDTTVTKIYAPGFIPRLIYWLAFQAEFPYIANQTALRAAVLRRNLTGMLTEYWYGENRVARAIGVDVVDGRYGLTSERINGTDPTNHHAARAFLFDLADRFDEAGLPTWQVDPRQPRAIDNILETPDGRYHIIDLESGLVSPLVSPRAWWRAVRRAHFPLYDDLYFDLLWAYVEREGVAMREKLGEGWLARLEAHLAATEEATNAWIASEPRIWSRVLAFVLARLHLGLEPGSPRSSLVGQTSNA